MKRLKQENQKKQNPKRLARAYAALAIASLLFSGCGNQAYVATSSQAQQQAPGKFLVPPKVDILLVQDDTGSSKPIFTNISSQLKEFLGSLQNRGWDYHFATVPLTHQRALTQVQASKFDPNWGSQWLSPYPGAVPSLIAAVTQAAFRFPDAYKDFLTGDKVTSSGNGSEPGLDYLRRNLTDASMTSTGFLRQDALLAVVLLSTGDDTSERNFCGAAGAGYGYRSNESSGAASCDLIAYAVNGTRPDIPCGQPGANPQPYCNNYAPSLAVYRDFLANLKGNPSQTRLYPVVANSGHLNDSCMGANSFAGSRYQELANQLNGQSFDICSTPIPMALTGIAANLETLELRFYTHYLFMAQEPAPATIRVYRNPGGDASHRVEIQRDGFNGWSFAGQINNAFTISIDDPNAVPTLNRGSGWAVQLHGSGTIGGSDTATVEFTPAGLQNSGG